MIHNHPSCDLEPSDADLSVAARLYEEGIGTAIINNDADQLFVVVEPPKPRVVQPLEIDQLEALIGPAGPLVQEHPAYEDRPGSAPCSVASPRHTTEAASHWSRRARAQANRWPISFRRRSGALRNGERTVISTNTINLQEQLDDKELPLVRRLVGEEVDWELVKGRGTTSPFGGPGWRQSPPRFFFWTIGQMSWISYSSGSAGRRTGPVPTSRSCPPRMSWDEVKSDTDICLGARCPHFQACFYQRSRRRAASATLLITNHHLLFSDLSVRIATQNYKASAVLPAYRHLILDEAHNIEDVATSHLGLEVTRRGMFRMLARLDRRRRGVLGAVQDALAGRNERGPAMELRSRIEERVRPALEEARAQLTLFLDVLEPLLPSDALGAVRIGTAEMPEPASQPDVRERLDGLVSAFRRWKRSCAMCGSAWRTTTRWPRD